MKAQAVKRKKNSSARCIYCVKSCSMSGMCMKPWPEFRKGVVKDGKGHQEDSEN